METRRNVNGLVPWGMGKLPKRTYRPLYIGQWIIRLGRKPREVAAAAGIDESYLSNLISGEKRNPSAAVLFDISDVLGITVNDLYRPPPPASAVERAGELSPAQIAALGALLDKIGRK